MKNIWLKIGLGAGAIFAVGMILVSLVKAGRNKFEDLVNSDADIRIPLMGIVPFQLSDQRLGDLRRVTLLRDSPKHLTGVRVEVRLADSATIGALKDCQFLTLNDPTHLNEHTRFTCVADSAGLSSFGTVEIRHRQGDEPTTLVRTLVLAPGDMAALQAEMGPRVGPDSAQMAALELMGDSLRAMGDSIRAATIVQVRIAEQQAREGAAAASSVTVDHNVPTPPPTPTSPRARSAPAARP